MSRDAILRRFGPTGLTDYAPACGRRGATTDDTQMTLFTAEGLLRGHVRLALKGISFVPGITAHAHLRWLGTQGMRNEHDLVFGEDDPGWLIGHAELHDRRAPGNTCLGALVKMTALGEPADNDSKGCGGVMRAAPVGLFAAAGRDAPDLERTFDGGVAIAAITHGHPTGSLTAGVLAVMVAEIVRGRAVARALKTALGIVRGEAMPPRRSTRCRRLGRSPNRCCRPTRPSRASGRGGWPRRRWRSASTVPSRRRNSPETGSESQRGGIL